MTIKFPKYFITKLLIAFALLSTITLILSCSGGKPDDISEQHYKYALKAIEIADAYLDYDLSANEAYSQITDLKSRESELPDSEFIDATHFKATHLELNISFLRLKIGDAKYNASSEIYNKIVEYRNEIAETIGMKKR